MGLVVDDSGELTDKDDVTGARRGECHGPRTVL